MEILIKILLLLCFASTMAVGYSKEAAALLQIVLYQPDPDSGRYKTFKTDLTGHFARAGPTSSAEGEIEQIHPLSLCGTESSKKFYGYGWVGVIQLEHPTLEPLKCTSALGKAEKALDEGATAIIFDISKYPDAWIHLNSDRRAKLDRPIVLVEGFQADQLMNIIKNKKVARARIIKMEDDEQDNSTSQNLNMAIFMGCFVVVFVILMVLIAKVKCKKSSSEVTLNGIASDTLRCLPTRKYQKQIKVQKTSKDSDRSSLSSGVSLCAICLEEFTHGQELRIVPCCHEFHKNCVDPWLKEKHTCPLCNYNILHNPVARVRSISTNSPTRISLSSVEERFVPLNRRLLYIPRDASYDRPRYTELYCDVPHGAQQIFKSYSRHQCQDGGPVQLNNWEEPGVRVFCPGCRKDITRHEFSRSSGDLPPSYDSIPQSSVNKNHYRLPQGHCCVTDTPSLASGYLPEDLSDENFSDNSDHRLSFVPLFLRHNDADSSVRSNFGSTLASDPQTASMLTPSDQYVYLSNKSPPRPATPFIGYSSSDGTDALLRHSQSSLEEILETISTSSTFNSRMDGG